MVKPHFRIFGIPVRVELFFFLLVGFLGWSSGRPGPLLIAWVVIVFVSILWHELGHAFAFRAFGYPPSIVLHGFGGATSSLMPAPLPPKKDIAITLAGPAAGMLLGGAVYLLSRYLNLDAPPADVNALRLRVIVSDLLFVNIGWGIFNMLPMLPLDGGRVMAATLNLATKGKGETPALVISLVVGAAIAAAAYLTQNTWAALLVVFLGLGNFTALQQRRKLVPQQENLEMLRDGYEALDRRDLSTASARAAAVLANPKSEEVKASAINLLMWTQMGQGKFQEAAQVGEKAFEERPEPQLAYQIARAWAKAGWPNQSVNWLSKAVQNGYRNVDELDAEPDFASIRNSLEFMRLRDQVLGRPAGREASMSTGTAERPDASPGAGDAATGTQADENPAEAPRPAAPQSQRVTVVKAILLINVAIFLAQMVQPSLTGQFGQSPQDIANGQWYRLLTPMLLHADWIHIGFNSYALWIYGPAVEDLFGKFRFLGVYVIAGFTGNVASYAFGNCPSLGVGASGAIFGIIGVLLVVNFARRKKSRAGAANLQGLLMIIGLNLVIGFTVPQIDNFAHMGGLAGGILVGGAFDLMQRQKAGGRLPAPVSAGAQTAAAAAVTVAAAALAVYHTVNFTC